MPTAHADLARQLAPSRPMAFLRSVTPLAIGLVIALIIHRFTAALPRGGYINKIVLDIGINIVLAVSLNIVNGFTGQFSIGHAGFMLIGGYTAGLITYYGSFLLWGSKEFHGGFLSWTQSFAHFDAPGIVGGDGLFIVALIVGGLVAALFGFVVGLPSLRLRGDYLAIVTLGFGEIVRVIIESTRGVLSSVDEVRRTPLWQLPNRVGGPIGFIGLPFYASGFWIWTVVTFTLLIAYRLKASTQGRAFLAIRENEIAAAAVGVPVTRYKVRAFVISAFLAGVAGGLVAHQSGNLINPGELGFQKSFDIVIMVVLGGMGSISGATLAAAALTVLPELLREFAEYRMIVYALLLIIMMIARPQGILGVHELWDIPRLWRERRARVSRK